MHIDRWEPFREMVSLRDAVQNLLAESLTKPESDAGTHFVPAVDVHETPDAYDVHVSMPGIRPEDVHVTVHGNMLTVAGESKGEEQKTEGSWIVRERRNGKFSRSLTMACALDADKAVAKTENGIVKLHLPKAETERPKQIKVIS
ncbi:Hsp20 family protein [bacterium]|nr:Hsp20 family protein [bacterium]